MADDRGQRARIRENEPRSGVHGSVHPERPTGGPAGREVPEADRVTWETATRKPPQVPDEPLPPQD